MKKRIKNIKNPGKTSVTAVVIAGMLALFMAGCSLVDVNQETVEVIVPSTEIEQSESSATEQILAALPHPDDLYVIGTLYEDEVMPTEGHLEDGFYTVSMTPNRGANDDGYDCVFYPWAQLEVDKHFIYSLYEGMILDFTGWGELNTVTVYDIVNRRIDPYSYMGTDYTGEVVILSTNKGNILFCKVDGVDKWKASIDSIHEPIRLFNKPVSVSVADDCIIYDAMSFINSIDLNNTDISQIDIRDVNDFTNNDMTKGITGSINEFFDKGRFPEYERYDHTMVKIENNTVTEVYFWA